MSEYYTVVFKIPDEHRPLTYVASDEDDAYQYYDMIREQTGVEYAKLTSPAGGVIKNWEAKV